MSAQQRISAFSQGGACLNSILLGGAELAANGPVSAPYRDKAEDLSFGCGEAGPTDGAFKRTWVGLKQLLSAALMGLTVGMGALSTVTLAEGSAAQGRLKNQMCMGCHGIPGYRTAFPEVYSVPEIAGQHPAYLVAALKAYQDGSRAHPSMRSIAASLSERDMWDLAAYYGGGRTSKTPPAVKSSIIDF